MRAYGIAEVLESTASSGKFKNGDLIVGGCNWSEHAVLNAAECTPIVPLPNGMSPTHYLGGLGMTGLTAYYGLVEVARTKPIDVVVVSGAAGATGSMVVQIAKHIIGCRRVIGLAGGADKCKWVESLGADACVDYKNPPGGQLREGLKTALGEGQYADVYFDNVGGEILDTMLTLMVNHGRVAACGSIQTYNKDSDKYGLKNWFPVVVNRIEIKGFILYDFVQKRAEVLEVSHYISICACCLLHTDIVDLKVFRKALAENKIRLDEQNETVVDTKFEDVPRTWFHLFEGKNQGKLVTKIVG